MKKVLFIGHEYHKKTHSADFLSDMLSERYDATLFYIDPYCVDKEPVFDSLRRQKYDFLICWQIMPNLEQLKKYFDYGKCIFFPMYDGIRPLSDPNWLNYKEAKIINFCKTLHLKLKKIGFDSEYIQYFPKPAEVFDYGDESSLFFWQRRENIHLGLMRKLFRLSDLKHIHLHKAMDPEQNFKDYSIEQELSVSTWFDKRSDLYAQMQKSALYMAPRELEGIGMSFLEAMAMGRCVIAPNYPTMNEYIQHGQTGFLYDLKNPQFLHMENVEKIQKNTLLYIQKGYSVWQEQKSKIFDWIEEPCKRKKWVRQTLLFGFIPLLNRKED